MWWGVEPSEEFVAIVGIVIDKHFCTGGVGELLGGISE
jgi:hypothetical protein